MVRPRRGCGTLHPQRATREVVGLAASCSLRPWTIPALWAGAELHREIAVGSIAPTLMPSSQTGSFRGSFFRFPQRGGVFSGALASELHLWTNPGSLPGSARAPPKTD